MVSMPFANRSAEPTDHPGLTAVLIDDMPEVRLLLKVALEDVGIEVVGEAADGASGVEVTALQMPDIVVLDVSMPVMDGIAALPWIRDTVPDAKIVMLSAYDRRLTGGPEASSEADAYVEKGHVDVFIRTVLSLCGQELDEVLDADGADAGEPPRLLDGPLAEASLISPDSIPWPRPGQDEPNGALTAHGFPLSTEDEAKLARDTLRDLAQVAGHDLAEPVSLVVGFAERLAARWQTLGLEPKDREFVAFTGAAASRLQVMVDALGEYLRACTEPLAVEVLDVNEVMSDVLAMLARRVRDTGAEVSVSLPPELVANRHVLTTTLRLLVENSLTFVREGVRPIVTVGAERTGDCWTIRVRDNGIGIDPRDAERVFRPFKHLAERDSHPGCGMGLAICRQLVRRHGGEIAVRGGTPPGCVVEFTLPVVEPEEAT